MSRRGCRSSRDGWRPTTSPARTRSNPSSEGASPVGLPNVALRLDRLRTTFRLTYAFHAREVRFERGTDGSGFESRFERVFAETFSFHAERHDPTELTIQLEDLWANPRRIGPHANKRDAEDLVRRLLAGLPRCLESAMERLEAEAEEDTPMLGRVCEDVALFGHVASRFLADKRLEDHPQVRMAAFHLRRVVYRALLVVVRMRVSPEACESYIAGELELDTGREFGAYYALAGSDAEVVDRTVLGAAERAFYRWVEDVCLDAENQAFEVEGSPFRDRASEVLQAVAADDPPDVRRARDLTPFLRRPGNKNCIRVLEKLETWFLRQYDVHHGAVVLHHAARLQRGDSDPDRVLSWHSRRTYLLALLIPSLPFLAAIFLYEGEAARALDVWVSLEVFSVIAVAVWVLGYRFLWKKDLTFFHAAVPRVAAGIIVGYLPVFLIDEVWDLAAQSMSTLVTVVVVLGMPTLLYIYVEVQRRLGDPEEAFRRALDLFLLGLLQSAAFGLVVTSLLGPLMSTRNWGEEAWRDQIADVTLLALRGHLEPVLGLLPRVMGLEAFPAFPSTVLLMSFLAFFIGTFLQLLWEDLAITEPM